MITFENITKKYNDKVVLKHLTLEFPEDGAVCIVGPSGIGKTTIFNLILGLESPDSGSVSVSIPEESAKTAFISVVFQEDRLIPWENVLDNVLIPGSNKEHSVHILEELGLGSELAALPSELSGGMARRVSIARALAVNADIYLMDEPTKGLDEDTAKKALGVIRKYTCDRNKLLIMITHNPAETENSHVIDLSCLLSVPEKN